MASDPSYETPTAPAAPPVASHQEALERFTLCEEAFHDQRQRELDDLRFVDERGAQWPDDIKAARGGQGGGGRGPPGPRPPVPRVQSAARPRPAGRQYRPPGQARTLVCPRGRGRQPGRGAGLY